VRQGLGEGRRGDGDGGDAEQERTQHGTTL
jgi:hypothetical protein